MNIWTATAKIIKTIIVFPQKNELRFRVISVFHVEISLDYEAVYLPKLSVLEIKSFIT